MHHSNRSDRLTSEESQCSRYARVIIHSGDPSLRPISMADSALAPLLVSARNTSISHGVHLKCFGPIAVPAMARSLRRLTPLVQNGSGVHHMLLFGGPGDAPEAYSSASQMCSHRFLYGWARGSPSSRPDPSALAAPLDFGADGYSVGIREGGAIGWVALQIHYQQMSRHPVRDDTGVSLQFSRMPARQPLTVHLMSLMPAIPPGVEMDMCHTLRVWRSGAVFGFRNHAHRLAREIWSDVYDGLATGAPLPALGNRSAQEPQLIQLLEAPRTLPRGSALQLHCKYDSRGVSAPTLTGLDERFSEMCNQYLVATPTLKIEDQFLKLDTDEVFARNAHAAMVGSAMSGSADAASSAAASSAVSAVSAGTLFGAVAVTDSSPIVVFATRVADGERPAALLRLSAEGELMGELARGLLRQPSGISLDEDGFVWLADIGHGAVWQLHPTTGRVLVSLQLKHAHAELHAAAPTAVAASRQLGEVFVCFGGENPSVGVFSYSEGVYLRGWGAASGSSTSSLASPPTGGANISGRTASSTLPAALPNKQQARVACDNMKSADWCATRIEHCHEEYVTERCRATCNDCRSALRQPSGIALDTARGRVHVSDSNNSRVHVFDVRGEPVATWVSSVGTEGIGGVHRDAQSNAQIRMFAQSVPAWRRRVAAIAYHASLDVFTLVEGSSVTLRSPSGCIVATLMQPSSGRFEAPTSAVLLPARHGTPHTALSFAGALEGFILFVTQAEGRERGLRRFSVSLLVPPGVGDQVHAEQQHLPKAADAGADASLAASLATNASLAAMYAARGATVK